MFNGYRPFKFNGRHVFSQRGSGRNLIKKQDEIFARSIATLHCKYFERAGF
jgi:hypothetical protein